MAEPSSDGVLATATCPWCGREHQLLLSLPDQTGGQLECECGTELTWDVWGQRTWVLVVDERTGLRLTYVQGESDA